MGNEIADSIMAFIEAGDPGCRLLTDYLKEVGPCTGEWRKRQAKDYASGRAILAADEADQVGVLLATCRPLSSMRQLSLKILVIQPLIQELFRRGITFSEPDFLLFCQGVVEHSVSDFDFTAKRWIVRSLEKAASEQPLSQMLRDSAALIEASLRDGSQTVGALKLIAAIQALLNGRAESPLHEEEAWGAAVAADWRAMPGSPQKAAWLTLLTHALASDAARPSAKWLKEAKTNVDALGAQTARAQIAVWLEKYQATPLPRSEAPHGSYEEYEEEQRLMTHANHNYQAVKGLVWLCRLFDDVPTARLVGDVALHSLKKIPGHGPKSAKVGTAGILTLAAMSGTEPIAQLSRLKTRVTYQAALGVLDKALNEAATRSGLTCDDLEDLAVPDFGLDVNGERHEQFGDSRATVRVTASGGAEVSWTGADGKPLKSLPVAVKREHADALKLLKRTAAELQEALLTQRNRLEDALRGGRTWPLHVWRERCLNHPLLRQLTGRLIWQFGEQAGVIREGVIEDANGSPLTGLSEETPVRLWHPLASTADDVFAWRIRLEQQMVTQPFKQAHREVYLLTDAERETRTYSNRFAAYVLKQHQFSALCQQRGWQYKLQGHWDGHNVPTLRSHLYGLSASFMVDGVDAQNGLADSYVYLYVTTGAVEFRPLDGGSGPLPLDQIPPLAFSEIMRDADLFVGVAGVGNDPTWADDHHRVSWQDQAFGDLGETAKTRADVLSRLLPRLKVAARCHVDGRFLVVRGDLRTYKIHLGSGNVLMEPNDQYLCIVPGRGDDDRGDLFLPFEGDKTLAIILSKALLLADDTAIKDQTIVNQIKR